VTGRRTVIAGLVVMTAGVAIIGRAATVPRSSPRRMAVAVVHRTGATPADHEIDFSVELAQEPRERLLAAVTALQHDGEVDLVVGRRGAGTVDDRHRHPPRR